MLRGNGIVDHWYWLLYVEHLKEDRTFPTRLPHFMLEIDEQWYPPLFPRLLALLPTQLITMHGAKISQMVDSLCGMIIAAFVFWITKNAAFGFLAGMSYILSYLPLSINIQLQPRGLSNLVLTVLGGGIWLYLTTHSLWIWLAILSLSTCLLFIHKMTTQIWVVFLLAFGAWTRDWTVPLLLPISILLAIIVSKGFYVKVLRAHWDIISYWHENMYYLGSHQYYESPLYSKPGHPSTALHQKEFSSKIKKVWTLFIANPFVIIVPILVFQSIFVQCTKIEQFLWIWVGTTYLWAVLTTFVPYLMALGAGVYYVYHSFFPFFLLTAYLVTDISQQWLLWLLAAWGLALFLSGALWRKVKEGNREKEDLLEVLEYLRGLPKDGVFCIPFTLPDITAYFSRKKVFWGGHGYGFHTYLKPYFPIMRRNVLETLRERPLNYLLFWRTYLDSLEDIGLKTGRDLKFLFGKGEYELYEVIK